MQHSLFNYLDSNKDELGISQQNLDSLQSWFSVLVWALFGLAVLQMIRFVMSKKLRQYLNMDIQEVELRKHPVRCLTCEEETLMLPLPLPLSAQFNNLIAQEDEDARIRRAENQEVVREKYDGLRAKYRSKYGNVEGGQESLLDADTL